MRLERRSTSLDRVRDAIERQVGPVTDLGGVYAPLPRCKHCHHPIYFPIIGQCAHLTWVHTTTHDTHCGLTKAEPEEEDTT